MLRRHVPSDAAYIVRRTISGRSCWKRENDFQGEEKAQAVNKIYMEARESAAKKDMSDSNFFNINILSSISRWHETCISLGKRYMLKKVSLFLVLQIAFLPLPSHLHERTEGKSWEKAYEEGRDLFYALLEKMDFSAKLEEKDSKSIRNARKRISGLYEHLMNFYFFAEPKQIENLDISEHFPKLSGEMAREFMDSIPARRWQEDKSPLQSVLESTGYYARKFTPQFRKFLRPITRRAKSQWILEELEIRRAHRIAKGRGIRLAIIDTGVDPTIKEIKAQIQDWKNFLDCSSPFGNEGKFPYDWGGHGTSIATVVSQIAPDVELMIVKVFDQETMFYAPFTRWNMYLIAAGINWAIQNKADIISLSIALHNNYKEIRDASESAWKKNITLISAAGNVESRESGSDAYYPASYPWSIGVGGVEKKDENLTVWEHSARGYYIDVVAPAAGIWVESPSYLDRRRWPTRMSGNSLAVPIVAATSALILSSMEQEKKKTLEKTPGALVEVVRSILREASSNTRLGYLKPNPASGFGLINAYQAVKMARVFK